MKRMLIAASLFVNLAVSVQADECVNYRNSIASLIHANHSSFGVQFDWKSANLLVRRRWSASASVNRHAATPLFLLHMCEYRHFPRYR